LADRNYWLNYNTEDVTPLYMKKVTFFCLLVFSTGFTAVQAAPNGTGGVNKTLPKYNFDSTTPPESETIRAGRSIEMNLGAPRYTSNRWTGVFGNITSQYIIGSNSSSSFFSWDLVNGNYVYATSSSIDFTSDWESADASDLENEYPFLKNATEQVSETFNQTADINSDFQNNFINDTIASVTYNNTGKPYWETMFLKDSENGFFAGKIKEGNSFEGSPSDYQMILPENTNDPNGTAYSLYVEVQ
jgi:hypothetical protein